MRGEGVIFFDLTQLLLRVAFPTPSGIGRVELAYANHLLASYPERVRFVFALHNLVGILPTKVVAGYVREIETIWGKKDKLSETLERRLSFSLNNNNILVDPTFEELNGDAKLFQQTNQIRRLSLAAGMLIDVLANIVRVRNLSKYSNSKNRSAYISVSNSIITSPWLIRWLARSPSITGIFLLHDLIPITNPEFTVPKTTVRHLRYIQRLTKSTNTIIVNSQYTLDCLKSYAQRVNLTLPDVVVSPLGIERRFFGERASKQPSTPYFVFTATIEPRKNHSMLLQVWQRLVAKLGPKAPKLVLVGRRGWENENTLDLIERAENLRDHVIECGSVPDQLLVKLLLHARAALFPSHIEGYGLPLAEALAMGVPVICSDIPPFKEIGGDIPDYADPLAGRGWLKLIADYAAEDSQRRAAQVIRIRRFKPHRWEDHLAALDSVLLGAQVIEHTTSKAVVTVDMTTNAKAPKRRLGVMMRSWLAIKRSVGLTRMETPATEAYREGALNAALAARLGRRGSQADLYEMMKRGRPGLDSTLSFRGLRCAILGKIADSPDARILTVDAARNRVDLGIAHMAIAVLFPPSLGAIELCRLSEAFGEVRFEFSILTEASDGEWVSGSARDLVLKLRLAHDVLVRDDALGRAVDMLNVGLSEVSDSLMSDHAACDKLVRLLGIGKKSNVAAYV